MKAAVVDVGAPARGALFLRVALIRHDRDAGDRRHRGTPEKRLGQVCKDDSMPADRNRHRAEQTIGPQERRGAAIDGHAPVRGVGVAQNKIASSHPNIGVDNHLV